VSTRSPAQELQALVERLPELLRDEDRTALQEALHGLHPSDVADVLESLDEEDGLRLLEVLPAEVASESLAEMEEEEDAGDLLAALDPKRGAELIHELADDDAADLVGELEPEEQDRILAALPIEEAGEIRGLLRYDEESAGGIMTTALVSIPSHLTAREALDEVRRQGREVEDFYTVFVVDGSHRLLGTVPLDDLILADPDEPVARLVEPVVASALPTDDQEEVGRIMSRYNLVSVPVLDENGVLLGRVTFDDVLDVLEAEQTEDILRMAGTSDDEELRGSWSTAVRLRLPWLLVNLVTAVVAASVVYLFADTIGQVLILAAIMPIIAGMGGNAGTQALAVTVRRLAVQGRTDRRVFQAVGKEVLVGLVNGAALGGVTALLSVLVGGDPMLGLVVLLAMWGNIVVAGFAGSFVPALLHRLGVDPAVASSVFVTTFTDLMGFFLLLGLASALLL